MKWIDLYDYLSVQNRELLKKTLVRKTYRKGEHILVPGKKSVLACAVHSGITRNYLVDSGKEITSMFCFRNEICCPLHYNTPCNESGEYIQAIVNGTEVSLIDLNEFEKLKAQNREFLQLEMYINVSIQEKLATRLRELQTLDAGERYLQLLEKEPDLLEMVSLTHIAFYLGIKLGSLSRIRSIVHP